MKRCIFGLLVSLLLMVGCGGRSNDSPQTPSDSSNTPPAFVALPATDSVPGQNATDNSGPGLDLLPEEQDPTPDYASPESRDPVGFGSVPPLPPILNPQLTVRGDTALVTFEPVAGARDYRIYPMPTEDIIDVDGEGRLSITNAVYRCSGDRPMASRPTRMTGQVEWYNRSSSEAVLGYVYVQHGPGRTPVWRLSDPAAEADYAMGTAYHESRHARYVASADERQQWISRGWRDDGIVFYAPESTLEDTAPVYRWESGPRGWIQDRKVTTYFRAGPEYDYRASDVSEADFEQPFLVHRTQVDETVPLYRVIYDDHHDHDVLAAGDGRLERIETQGNQPLWSVSWPGLTETTTLVVEALDEGCPFLGHIASESVPGKGYAEGYITLDQARLDHSGEVYINGQHDGENRPQPIARVLVEATPQEAPVADFFEGFGPDTTWNDFDLVTSNTNLGNYHYRNAHWEVDFSNTEAGVHSFGPLHGELLVAFADRGGGVNGRFRMSPRVEMNLTADTYVHASMDVDVVSTGRRYPQLMISSEPAPIQGRLTQGTTIVVQPFGLVGTGGAVELQVQFCDHRTWDVNNQCPQTDLATRRMGYSDERDNLPQPLLGELSGFDRKVRFDVYASTERVYVFVEERPAGCAQLPEDRMAPGAVSVSFGSVLYHSGIDEMVVGSGAPHEFLDRHGLTQTLRRFDNLAVSGGRTLPAWNHTVFPCAASDRWKLL